MLGEKSGKLHARGNRIPAKYGANRTAYGNQTFSNKINPVVDPGDAGTAARFFHQLELDPFIYQAKAARRERNRGCDALSDSGSTQSAYSNIKNPACLDCGRRLPGGGGIPDRCPRCGSQNLQRLPPKLDGSGRDGCKTRANIHPTVKSVQLMRHLCRLICPPGGIVLDPFAGSGSTGVACAAEGLRFLGVEQVAAYAEIARARLRHAYESGAQPKTASVSAGTSRAAPAQMRLI
jgi:DNA modification methylase